MRSDMNKITMLCAGLLMLFIGGCATSTYTVGNAFQSENVSKIVRNETTAVQLEKLVGKPYMATVLSADEVKYLYTYTHGTAKAQFTNVTSDSKTQTLDVLIKNGVVVNYTYSESNSPYTVTTN